MIYRVPETSFEIFLNDYLSCIIWFKNRYNNLYRNLRSKIEECAQDNHCIISVEIKFYCKDHVKYFPSIRQDNVILYFTGRRVSGTFKIRDESQIVTVFNFFKMKLFERICYFNRMYVDSHDS